MEFAAPLIAKLREQSARFRELTEYLSSPEAAADPRRMPTLLRQRGSLEATALLSDQLDVLLARRADAEKLAQDPDPGMRTLAREELDALEEEERTFDTRVKDALIAEPEDFKRKVIVEVRAGTGGDEASLFVGDLFKLYQRFIEAQGWRLELFEATASEVGGFKEVIFGVEGERVWSKLRFESGGHRVQRVPETEAQGRIHTSAATVAVLPEAEEVELEIRDQDLRIDTMRAGGAGGQHVNKTESAVRITHLPTNTVVVCMDEKSQHKNRARAMRVLRTRLLEAQRQKLHDERSLMRKTQVGSGDRNARIRTYNWPQNRMTDHRLNQNFSLEQVLAGKLDGPLGALESLDREERIKRL
ncbi:MAG TPA: peptide chain release factor 1 [Planctomycetota bacterium]|nr:peptide chain release factor 1 [Planctomycetota bacterium]